MTHIDKLKHILTEKFGIEEEEIQKDSDLKGDFNLSDLEISDLIGQIGKEFELNLPEDADSPSIKTVTDLLNFIDSYSEEL